MRLSTRHLVSWGGLGDGCADIWFEEKEPGDISTPGSEPLRVRKDSDGSAWPAIYRPAGGYLLQFPPYAEFTLDAAGRELTARRSPATPAGTVDYLLHSQVIPLALSMRGDIVLHGGAVEIDGFAVLLLGPSGRGKSTLTASFAAAGHPFLADDGVLVAFRAGGLAAVPGQPSIRVWGDSGRALMDGAQRAEGAAYTSKACFVADSKFRHAGRELPVGAIYFLSEPATAPVFERVPPGEAIYQLMSNSFLLDTSAPGLLQARFEFFARVARTVAIYRFGFPRRYEMLAQVRTQLAAHARGLQEKPRC
ncbi:hypothetical protein [Ramlibacter albus]|uniref:Uncharacterized protein n=1 Tax=Ramlibacter albus TaxID=2079448 RepID=A0A923M7K2_9BURK|nr:hypothetical protein [Ramlibacter albus]MBC5765303.1 hypothetical protein [Ramlibacter albus]